MDDRSFEECTVTSSPDGVRITGHIIAAEEREPLVASYDIACDGDWSAQTVTIEQRLGDTLRRLKLERAGPGWLIDGARAAQLDGCAEPDLGLTPSTNALAIRRLGLEIGQGAEIACAWVKFPALSVETSLQRYERLADRAYRYTNLVSGFTAIVTVDAMALPVSYERIWMRIADWRDDGSGDGS